MKIYRYIPFETFIDIVVNNTLTLLSPCLWEDSFEGWFWKMFQDSEKAGAAADMLYNTVFAQCWSKNRDSAALWSIYSYNKKAVMIESTKESLESLGKLFCKDIDYSTDANLSIDDLVAWICNPDPRTLVFPFTTKRSEFLHENETRLFAVVKDNPERKRSLEVPVGDVKTVINSVVVHPFADDWYVKIVEGVCKKYNIRFSGKSHLYDIDYDGGDAE